MPQCIRIHPADNVAVALCPIPAGTRLSLEGRAVQMREDIPQGHKLALAQIAAGENIIKYGYPIGHAASVLPASHNSQGDFPVSISYSLNRLATSSEVAVSVNAESILTKTKMTYEP